MVKSTTVLLIVCVVVATASQDEPRDFLRTGEMLPLAEQSIVPSTIETIFREFLGRHPRGEVSMRIVPREQKGPVFVYREGRRAAFMFRIGGNVFYYYVDPPDTAEWRILEGRNVFDPQLPGVTVDFAYHTFVMYESELDRRELGLVVPELGRLEVPQLAAIARHLAGALPGPSLRIELGETLDRACWSKGGWPGPGLYGRCPDKPDWESHQVRVYIEDVRPDHRRTLSISRHGRVVESIEW
jgi:hypothetical protein